MEQASFFGLKYMKNKLSFYDYDWAKRIYHYILPEIVTAEQIAQDCLQFIELDKSVNIKNIKFHCINSYDE